MSVHLQPIPLFPLDVVLFPGMVLPLHIFEDRYRQMVRDCMIRGETFGMVWTENEHVELLPDRPLIGTKAMMTEIMPFPDGRFNINTVGSERFMVHELSQQEPYVVGSIEPFPSIGGDSGSAQHYMKTLTGLFTTYMALLGETMGQEVTLDPLPDDPMILSFIVAILYQCQNWRKQELLSIRSIPELMSCEIEILRIENPLLRDALQMREMDRMAPLIVGSLAIYGLN
ncbi:MAG: LON peptidase substrate-binding domain-containing protein [Ardenticatenales bacterium]|nr:LON peptidase substrate-binding domain-containing protein [Ardenticatenales bacterium]